MHRRSAFCHAGPVARFIVAGGGISGLTAARDLADAGHDVLLLEGTDRLGGKLSGGEVAGITVDVGAEAMINRQPAGVQLATSLGLPVTHATGTRSRIWTRGALRPLPRTLMGAPLDIDELEVSGILRRRASDGHVTQRVPASRATSRSPTWSRSGTATRSPTGSSSRSSGGSMPAPRVRSPPAPPSRGSSRCSPPRVVVPPARLRGGPVFAGVPGGMWRSRRHSLSPVGPPATARSDPAPRRRAAPYPGGLRRRHRRRPRTRRRRRAGDAGRTVLAAAGGPGAGGSDRAGGDRVRLVGRGDARLPRRSGRVRRPRHRRLRLPGAADRRPGGQGIDVLLRQVVPRRCTTP